MHDIFKALAVGALLFTFPTTVFASSESAADSTEGQAMIKAPSSDSDDSWASANQASSPASGEQQYIVVIDPGHQGSWVDMSAQEPMAPDSTETKAKATTGTTGNYSGVPEYQLNLDISLLLRDELTSRGYEVYMTREDNDTAISNKERAEFAAEKKADITVRIHANSDTDSSASGALTMAPTESNQYLDEDIITMSNALSSCIINQYCSATGLANLGTISSDNMTGTNWSTVPVTILEMGFMSNESDDLYITNEENYPVMVQGIADGIDEYFSTVSGTIPELTPTPAADSDEKSDATSEAAESTDSENASETSGSDSSESN